MLCLYSEEKITEYPWYRLIDRFVEVHQKTAAPEIVNIVRQLETSSQPLSEEVKKTLIANFNWKHHCLDTFVAGCVYDRLEWLPLLANELRHVLLLYLIIM